MAINWPEVITTTFTTVGGSVAFLAAAAWLIKAVISDSLARNAEAFKIQVKADADREIEAFRVGLQANANTEIERLKNALQITADERKVQFSNLHETRAQRIADLYGRITEQSVACQRYVYQLKESTRQEGFMQLEKGFSDFYLFSEASRIYLPEHVCALLEKLISTIRKPVVDVYVYGETDNYANDVVRKEKK